MYGKTPEEVLSEIRAADADQPRQDVVVLGAGMAGLVACHELAELGHNVVLIEAQKRVGGRVWTHHFKNGDYHELGAMRIPKSHAFTRHYIDKCGLQTRRFVNHHDDPDGFYSFRGAVAQRKEASAVVARFALSEREQSIVENSEIPFAPIALFDHVLQKELQALRDDPASLAGLFARGPLTDRNRKLESQTLYQFLKEGLDTEDAIELVGAATGLEVWWDKVISMLLRDEIVQYDPTGLDEIVGGSDLLARGMLDLCRAHDNVSVELNTMVHAIHNRAASVDLVTSPADDRANVTTRNAEKVICTIPYSVLRRLDLSGLSDGKHTAIRNLTYASSTKVLFSCRERFWELHYGIVGSGSQQDRINRQVYYPSDSYVEQPIREMSPSRGALVQYIISDKIPRDVSSPTGSGALVGSYCWGADARRLAALSHDERARVVAQCVSAIHSEILDDGMILESCSIAWDEFEWSAGAFCFMKPLDLERYYEDTIKPEGRLSFAGEHCSLDQGWIQGAVSSALRTVQHVVAP